MANLPLLPPFMPLVDANGTASSQMTQFWQQFEQAITQNILDIQAAVAQALAALNQATDALNQATDALNAATAAQTAAIAAQASANTAQTTANGKLDQTTADGLYVHQHGTAAWAAPTGVASRATFAGYTAPTVSNPPTQAEVQGAATAAQTLSQHLVALLIDLKANNTLT